MWIMAVGVPRMKRRAGIRVLKNSVNVIRTVLSPVRIIRLGKKSRSEIWVKRRVNVLPNSP